MPIESIVSQVAEGVVTFRNICGHIAPILVEIASMEIFLGLTDILLIHHTGE